MRLFRILYCRGIGWPAMAALLLAAGGVRLHAGDYDLDIVVEDDDVINGHSLWEVELNGLSLNNPGQLVFGASYSGGSGIFTPSGQLVASGTTIGGETLSGVRDPWINDLGGLIFHGTYGDSIADQGIFTPSGTVAVRGNVIDGYSLEPSLESELIPRAWTDSGLTVFQCSVEPFNTGNFTQNDKIAVFGDTIDGKTLSFFSAEWGSPSVNSSGTAVFVGGWGGGVANSGIFNQTDLLVAVGDTIGSKTLTEVSGPKINDAGNIVFEGHFSGGSGLFTPDGLIVSTGDTIDGKTLEYFGSFSENSDGDVAFLAGFDGGSEGVFTPDSLIAAIGDTVDGKVIESFWHAPVINDAGHVAFSVRFADTPQPSGAIILAVPEPSTLVLLSMGAVVLLAYAWRRRRWR